MNPPWLCVSADYRRSLGETQSYKYNWDESNPKRLSHKLYQITHRFWEGLENGIPHCILAQHSAHRCDSCWVCQKKPCRGHSGQTFLAVSNMPAGLCLTFHNGTSPDKSNRLFPLPVHPSEWGVEVYSSLSLGDQLSVLLSVSLLKGGWRGKWLWDNCDTEHVSFLPA